MPRVPREVSRRGRQLLDGHFDEWQQLRGLARPPKGWIRAIREALGMSAAALGGRLGVTAGAVTRLEQSEAADRIQLDTLRRTADALGCDLVYLLVPRRPLTTVVRERAPACSCADRIRRAEHAVGRPGNWSDEGDGRPAHGGADRTRWPLESG